MEHVRPFANEQLEAIARILANTEEGLTGTEIGYFLNECRIPDVSPNQAKENRLLSALVEYQNSRQFGNHVLMFINRAMNPANYTNTRPLFAARQIQLATVLAVCRMTVGDDGKVRRVRVSPEAGDPPSREERLHAALTARGAHQEVLRICRAELVQTNYCRAIFEALRIIADRLKSMSELTSDGTDLVRQSFGTAPGKRPVVAINPLETDADRAEQRGFANLLAGLMGTIRNPAKHDPKIEWEMEEHDAMDILTMASLVHRRLDRAKRVTQPPASS